MAVWQADYLIVPSTMEPIQKEERRDYLWWGKYDFDSQAEKELQKLLPRTDSWDEDLDCYGFEDLDRIEIWKEDGRVSDIFIRFDLREPYLDLIKRLLQICSKYGLYLLDEKDEYVLPELEGIKRSLRESSAYRFVKNPIEFLKTGM